MTLKRRQTDRNDVISTSYASWVQERFLGKKQELWMAFVDLEKASDRVPREVVWWALR